MTTMTRQRGLGLVDALIGLLMLTLGLLAVLQLQPELRRHAELARQRSEAVRLAQAEIEAARTDPALLTPDSRTIDATTASTRYQLQREVDAVTWPNATALRVQLRWTAADGAAQQLELATLVTTLDAALPGIAVLPR